MLDRRVKLRQFGPPIGRPPMLSSIAGPSAGGPSTLLTNLVAYWPLNEASGTRADATGRGNDLTDNNTVVGSGGVVGNSAVFVGGNLEYLSHADNADLSMGDIDFEFWCWVYLEPGATHRALISKDDTPGGTPNRREYSLQVDTANKINWYVMGNDDSLIGYVQHTTVLTPRSWYLVTCYHNAAANLVGVTVNNGAAQTAATGGPALDSGGLFTLGARRRTTTDLAFDGRLDEVGMRKQLLTTTERTALYNGGFGLTYPFDVPTTSPLLNSLVAYWKLDEASGTRVDSTLRGNDLADFNTVTSTTGIQGSAAQFVAANTEYLGRASTADLTVGTGSFTISAWVYLDSLGGTQIVAAKGSGASQASFEVLLAACHVDQANQCTLQISNGFFYRIVNGGVLTANAWHHLVAWYDRTVGPLLNLFIEVDGVQFGAASAEFVQEATLAFALGRASDGKYLNGRIDEVGLWKRILTSHERARLFNAGAGVTYPGF